MCRLPAEHIHEPGVRVSKGIYRDAAEEIQVLTAMLVIQITSVAAHEDNGGAPVRIH
jgi:hypothetical protein